MKKAITWILVLYIVFVFIQSLFFKFLGSVETEIIFGVIGDWMAGTATVPENETNIVSQIGNLIAQQGLLVNLADPFRAYGGWLIGGSELLASILLLSSRTRALGALAALGIMSGAIFFHLGTPLGVDRVVDAQGNTDGGILFFMACGVWVSSLILLLIAIFSSDSKRS